MSVIQDAWQEVTDAILEDSGIKDHFTGGPIDTESGTYNPPYLNWTLGSVTRADIAVPGKNQSVLNMSFSIVEGSDDPQLLEKQGLKGLEFLINAIEKKLSPNVGTAAEVTAFVQKIVRIEWEIDGVVRIAPGQINLTGTFNFHLQPYTMGSL